MNTHCIQNYLMDKYHKVEIDNEDGNYNKNITSFLMRIFYNLKKQIQNYPLF